MSSKRLNLWGTAGLSHCVSSVSRSFRICVTVLPHLCHDPASYEAECSSGARNKKQVGGTRFKSCAASFVFFSLSVLLTKDGLARTDLDTAKSVKDQCALEVTKAWILGPR